MTDVVIGVDGGNSKTEVAVADTTGRVLALVRGPGSSPDKLGAAGAADVIDGLVSDAMQESAVPADARPVALATLLAGLDLAHRFPGEAMDAGEEGERPIRCESEPCRRARAIRLRLGLGEAGERHDASPL